MLKYFKLFLFLIISLTSYCQNIYSLENRIQYAHFLFKSNDFKKALDESISIEKEFPLSLETKILKTNCLLSLEQYLNAYDAINELPLDSNSTQEQLFLSLKCCLLSNNWSNHNLLNFLSSSKMNKELLCYHTYFVSGIDSAILFIKNNIEDSLQQAFLLDIITQPSLISYPKKPVLASFLSIIPGIGQFYSKQSSDGLTAISAIALNGAVSWVAFNQNGVQSILGWVSGSMAAGFYLGNIVGAYSSAVRLNQLKTKTANYEIKKRIINLHF